MIDMVMVVVDVVKRELGLRVRLPHISGFKQGLVAEARFIIVFVCT